MSCRVHGQARGVEKPGSEVSVDISRHHVAMDANTARLRLDVQ